MHHPVIKSIAALLVLFSFVAGATDFKVAVRAHNGIEKAVSQWQPTIAYLNKKIPAHQFKLVPVISLKEITIQAGRGSYDFILTNPSSFVEIESLHGVRAITTLVNDRSGHEESRFGSVIFTRAENEKIIGIHDLKGKKLMAVSESAFGGWRVAWLEMMKNGVDPNKELSVIFTDSRMQKDVVYAVRDKQADAGVVRTDQLEHMSQSGEIDMRYFRIVHNKNTEGFPFFHSTALYPEWPFAAMKHIPMDITLQVKEALLSINKNNNAAKIGKYIKWIEPLDYYKVRNLMIKLKLHKNTPHQK